MYSFVGRQSTRAETTAAAAAAAHLGVTTYTFFLMFVLVTFVRVLYNIHHVNQKSKSHTYSAKVPVLHTPVEVRFSMTCRFVHGQGKRGNVHIPAIMSVAFPDVVVFDGFILLCSLFTRKQNARERKNADVGISHQTENEKENFVYVTYTRYVYIPFLL